MLDDALNVIEHSISANRRDDGLYHAYNVMVPGDKQLDVDTLYPMLEGQVAVLSSGALNPTEVCEVIEALFDSTVFRADQNSFMLYPDRQLPSFLEKNVIPPERVDAIPLAMTMLADDGILISCSCSHHLDDSMFRQVLLEAARTARRPMRVLDWAGASLDHPQLLAVPETHYLKCAVLQAV